MERKERRAYLEAVWRRYKASDRLAKKQILDEFCAVCKYNRKYAIGLLNKPLTSGKTATRGRKSIYNTPQVLTVLHRIWKTADFMCSSRLKAAIPLWLPCYEQEYGQIEAETKRFMLSVSAATLDRTLRPMRARYRKGLCGTKPGTLLREQIPIRTGFWDVERPGFMEADTVAHCGNSLDGNFVWSLTMTDIFTGWTECRAVQKKRQRSRRAKKLDASAPSARL